MIKEDKHVNQNEEIFNIKIEKGDVPNDSDHFGFLFTVNLDQNHDVVCLYKGLVRKSFCKTENEAIIWSKTIGLNFLKEILDTYEDGKTNTLSSNSKGNWSIIGA